MLVVSSLSSVGGGGSSGILLLHERTNKIPYRIIGAAEHAYVRIYGRQGLWITMPSSCLRLSGVSRPMNLARSCRGVSNETGLGELADGKLTSRWPAGAVRSFPLGDAQACRRERVQANGHYRPISNYLKFHRLLGLREEEGYWPKFSGNSSTQFLSPVRT